LAFKPSRATTSTNGANILMETCEPQAMRGTAAVVVAASSRQPAAVTEMPAIYIHPP
jgi:hypothetical protein